MVTNSGKGRGTDPFTLGKGRGATSNEDTELVYIGAYSLYKSSSPLTIPGWYLLIAGSFGVIGPHPNSWGLKVCGY